MDRLQNWLELQGVDVLRLGNDLVMPSPFKERKKRRFDPTYVDENRRLSVKIITENERPVILWKCWYTSASRPNGSFGGKSAFALSVRTGQDQSVIYELLGIIPDVKTIEDKDLEHHLMSMIQPEERQETHKRSIETLMPLPLPTSCAPIYTGLRYTHRGERIMAERNIPPQICVDYLIQWDVEKEKLVLPFCDFSGKVLYYQYYDGSRYEFPKSDDPRYFGKGDVIFGLQRLRQNSIILTEGLFDALTLRGWALAGNLLSSVQESWLSSVQPKRIILAMDNDGGGSRAVQTIESQLYGLITGVQVVVVFPPSDTKDWNGLAKKTSDLETVKAFVERARTAMERPDNLEQTLIQMMQ